VCSRRLVLTPSGVEICSAAAQLVGFGCMVTRRGQAFARLAFALGRLQIRLGALTLRSCELLVSSGPFGLRAGLTVLGAEHVVARFRALAVELSLLAFGPATPHARDKHRGEDDE
jgi:hypothetical protein